MRWDDVTRKMSATYIRWRTNCAGHTMHNCSERVDLIYYLLSYGRFDGVSVCLFFFLCFSLHLEWLDKKIKVWIWISNRMLRWCFCKQFYDERRPMNDRQKYIAHNSASISSCKSYCKCSLQVTPRSSNSSLRKRQATLNCTRFSISLYFIENLSVFGE